MSDPIHVIGHRNPDTDASTSATAYARFLNEIDRYDVPVVAAVPGVLTPQADWVFQQAGTDSPTIVETFAPRVRDAFHASPEILTTDQRLGAAVDKLIRTGHSMLPVTDGDGRLISVFSNREDVSRFLMGFDVVPMAASLLNWHDVIAVPGMAVRGTSASDGPCGGLVIAMVGDDAWKDDITPEDILFCGCADFAADLPASRRPTRIVVISVRAPDDQAVRTLNQIGTNVLHYGGTVSDLLRALTQQIRLESLELGRGVCVGEDDLLSDVCELIAKSRRAVPVVGDDDLLTGVIARADLKAAPRRRAILIDHFETSQAVPGVEHLEIIEVVDHHRIGNIETPAPVRVDCRPIGSSASIVALNYFEANLTPDRGTSLLMLGGLCADTLALKGPTATAIDRKVAGRLAEIAGVDVETFGTSVLKAGDDLLTAIPAEIWNRDQKVFGIRNYQFAVAQLETVALDDLPDERLEQFRSELRRDFEQNDYLSSLLVVTDVLKRNSWITGIESSAADGSMRSAFGSESPKPGWLEARNIVSRKKQIIPQLMQTFAELAL